MAPNTLSLFTAEVCPYEDHEPNSCKWGGTMSPVGSWEGPEIRHSCIHALVLHCSLL